MNYVEDVLKTNSPQWYGKKLDLTAFECALIDVIEACRRFDKIKKFLFAGKGNFAVNIENCDFIPDLFGDRKIGIDIIHCIIGMTTEAGELCELLYSVVNGKPFDVVNFKEEIGDSNWYQVVGLNAIRSDYDEVMQMVIAKLAIRYKNKVFTTEECMNRDLDAERKTLESER